MSALILKSGTFPRLKCWGPSKGLIKLIWNGGRMKGMEEKIQEKVDSLMRYRESLAGSERELFDVLISYANEVAMAVDRDSAPDALSC